MITPDRLTERLRASGDLLSGAVQTVAIGEGFEAYATTLCRLHITYTADVKGHPPGILIYKAYGPDLYYGSGLREVVFYAELAPMMPSPAVPDCYGASADPHTQTCVLLLEDITINYTKPQLPLTLPQYYQLSDELVRLHTYWWEHPRLAQSDFFKTQSGVLRMPQAIAPDAIRQHGAEAHKSIERFVVQHRDELEADTVAFLYRLAERWADRFIERVVSGEHITLLHGDFHLLGNIFLPRALGRAIRPCILDWGQYMRGIGPHDIAYLLSVQSEPGWMEQETTLLRYYHRGLQNGGVTEYSWEQCLWDYRFSIATNTFTSIFQGSMRWLEKSIQRVKTWRCAELL
jgi:hypothetical protein